MKAATAKDVEQLSGRDSVEMALASGRITRVKLQGQWFYLGSGWTLEVALQRALTAVEKSLDEWLLNPGRFLYGLAVREMPRGEFGRGTMTLLIHELCARGKLAGLPLLTRARQPYLAFYRMRDSDEVARQVEALAKLISRHGSVTWRELPDPQRPVPRMAWRNAVIAHGEWLGLGWQVEPGTLERW